MVDVDDILFVGMRWGSANFSFGERRNLRARERRKEGRIMSEAASTKETSEGGYDQSIKNAILQPVYVEKR